jgi:hypothetical protein
MDQPIRPAGQRRINWISVSTVLSAAILISAEVFGAAYAGGWALGGLLGIGEIGVHICQGALFLTGIAIMVGFVRHAQQVEPFMR